MAFFKIRWPGQSEQAEKPAKRARSPQAESIEVMRRRARHRLIGAAVLVVVGVVGFPLLFDTQPRPIPVDIPIEIPDRDKVASLAAPTARAQQSSGASGAAEGSGLSEGEELVPSGRAASRPSSPPAAPRREARASAPAPQAVERSARTQEASATKPADDRFVVQVGAYSEVEKAREVRLKLEQSGLKTYTQVSDGKDGKRIRVRVGPFTSRAEADKTAARIKALSLSASVLTL